MRINVQYVIVVLLAVGVFCFWLFLYPFIPVMRDVTVVFVEHRLSDGATGITRRTGTVHLTAITTTSCMGLGPFFD